MGAGDTPFGTLAATGTRTVVSGGPRSPRIRVSNNGAAGASWVAFGQPVFGAAGLSVYALRLYVELAAYGSTSFTLASGYTANNATQQWKIELAGSGAGAQAGQIRIRTGANVQLGSSGNDVIPLNQVTRFELTATASEIRAYVFAGESVSPLASAAGTPPAGMTLIDTCRFGPTTTSPLVADFYLDDLAVSDSAELIGPVVAAGWVPSLWTGAAETALTVAGRWDGAVLVPLN
ncbi:hypothetical protein [Sinosporangium album]|uniref:hypothetical protein n=1 Tax=Sinosporangium album TaxID=504805 RepID=UPI00115FF130|nr:hypothetical protein [Sinosporangium album]